MIINIHFDMHDTEPPPTKNRKLTADYDPGSYGFRAEVSVPLS